MEDHPEAKAGTRLVEELERLAILRQHGALSEAEFEAAKRQLLNS
jgi:hypothetical protein